MIAALEKLYLDASTLVALLTVEEFTKRADAAILAWQGLIVVSDFAAAEFSSAIAKKRRMGILTAAQAEKTLATFDAWHVNICESDDLNSSDIATATDYVRRPHLNIRTPDAINLAIAMRLSATMLSFDDGMNAVALQLGCKVYQPNE
jgi:uncharacterized protein